MIESIVHVPSEDAENAMKSANASSTPTSVSIKRLGTDDGDDDDTFLFRSKDGVVVVLVDKVLLSFPKLNPLSLLVVVVVSNYNPLSLVVVVLNDNPPPPVVSLLVVEVVPNVNPIALESTILNPPNEGPSLVSSLLYPACSNHNFYISPNLLCSEQDTPHISTNLMVEASLSMHLHSIELHPYLHSM